MIILSLYKYDASSLNYNPTSSILSLLVEYLDVPYIHIDLLTFL